LDGLSDLHRIASHRIASGVLFVGPERTSAPLFPRALLAGMNKRILLIMVCRGGALRIFTGFGVLMHGGEARKAFVEGRGSAECGVVGGVLVSGWGKEEAG
jgi:hypothetical protein